MRSLASRVRHSHLFRNRDRQEALRENFGYRRMLKVHVCCPNPGGISILTG